MEFAVLMIVGVAVSVVFYKLTLNATSPQASRDRRVARAVKKQDIEDEARSRRQGGV